MKAATIAQRISEDPVMVALMPPQAKAAIAASKLLAVAAKRGGPHLKKLWGKLKGPGKRRLAEALEKEQREQEGVSGSGYGVRFPNRGAWQRAQDPYWGHEAEDDYDDADFDEDGEGDYGDIELGRRRGKKRRNRRRRERERDRDEAESEDPMLDEPQDAQPDYPAEEYPPGDGADNGGES
jgi:hypothetical protein